jgi:hypothetical protein
MTRILLALFTLSTLLLARNDVPSCYKALDIHLDENIPSKELFILVDQTTPLDKKMMIYIYKNMMHFIKNGNAITIASFSANANGKYADVAYEGYVEPLLSKSSQYDISKKKLRKYKACMNGQYTYAKKKATRALVRVLKGANKKLPHSDIFRSLHDLSKRVVKPSPASEKVVLIVSDGLEHSAITSFYHKGGIKKIERKKELQRVANSGFMADFDNARVYMIGVGATSNTKAYRDAKSIERLTAFWKDYFLNAHANLKAIGTPMLLEEIQ